MSFHVKIACILLKLPTPSNAARGCVPRNVTPDPRLGCPFTSIYIPTRIPSEWSVLSWVLPCHPYASPSTVLGFQLTSPLGLGCDTLCVCGCALLGDGARAWVAPGVSGLPCLGAWGPRDGQRFPLPFCVAFLNNNRNFWASGPSVGTPDLAPCLVSPACIPLVRKSY